MRTQSDPRGNGSIQLNPLYENLPREEGGEEEIKRQKSPSHASSTVPNWLTLAIPALLGLLTLLLFTVVIQISYLIHEKSQSAPVSQAQEISAPLQSQSGTPSLSLHKDQYTSRYYAQIPATYIEGAQPCLLVEQITQGVGLQALFWDPGAILGQDLVYFTASNDDRTVSIVASGLTYRSANASLIRRSFAQGVLWTGSVAFRDKNSYWVEAHDFLRLAPGIVAGKSLPAAVSDIFGSSAIYALDEARSTVEIPKQSNGSPTFVSDFLATYTWQNHLGAPPAAIAAVVSSGRFLSVKVRRTLVPLAHYSGDNDFSPVPSTSAYTPRRYHPKSGFNTISFMNEGADVFHNRQQLYITRHNLGEITAHKASASLPFSVSANTETTLTATQPILYLVDPLIPAPFLSAVVEGIEWWDAAFQAAGFAPRTLRVQVAPPNFDPYDLFRSFTLPATDGTPKMMYSRVHFVQWIDRDTRSYSVGLRVIDPRTGEILHGHVRLEGLRMRQDALLAEALLSPYSAQGALDEETRTQIMAAVLQRTRHLGAHEVGHSLGLAHNFAGSTYLYPKGSAKASYASVMDYPPPLLTLDPETKTRIVLNNASYSDGIGYFDTVAIRFGYTPFPEASKTSEEEWTWLKRMLAEAERKDYVFVTDQDSGVAGADWRDTKWDITAANATAALYDALTMRQIALRHLGLHSLHNDSAVSSLLQLVPVVYLWHRYEVEAVAKLVGGFTVQYPLRDDATYAHSALRRRPVNGTQQREAYQALIHAVSPQHLLLPSELLQLTGSTAFGYVSGRRSFYSTQSICMHV